MHGNAGGYGKKTKVRNEVGYARMKENEYMGMERI